MVTWRILRLTPSPSLYTSARGVEGLSASPPATWRGGTHRAIISSATIPLSSRLSVMATLAWGENALAHRRRLPFRHSCSALRSGRISCKPALPWGIISFIAYAN